MRLLPAAVCILLAPGLAAAQHNGLLFHADFDDGLDADVAAGDGTAVIRRVVPGQTKRPALDDIEMTGGVTGRAVVTEMDYLEYPGDGNINAAAGTVEMWVKPLDWTGDDEMFHVFFSTSKEPGWLILYKYFKGKTDSGISRKTAFYVEGDPGDERLTRRSVPYVQTHWQPGIWHHIAGTWEKGCARLFIDGAMVRERTGGAVPQGTFSLIKFGEPWGEAGNRRTAMDEVHIYNRPLQADEIRADFARGLQALAARAPDEMPRAQAVVKALGFPVERRIAVYVSAAGSPASGDRLAGTLAVIGADGAVVRRQDLPAFNDAQEVFAWIGTADIPPGDYILRAAVTAPGADDLVAETQCVVPDEPDWWDNHLGEEDVVLPPFTAIETHGLTVSPWGRDYDFTGALVLRQVTTHPDPNARISPLARDFHRDFPLLAGPVAVRGKVGGGMTSWADATGGITEADDTHVLLRARCEDERVTMESRTRLDYDGLAQIRLTITPRGTQTFEDMSLDIPLDPDLLKLMNFNSVDGSKMTSFAGAVPDGAGIVWENTWLPLIWLGDEYRGLCWFNDRDDGWLGDTMQRGRIQIIREADVGTLWLNFCPGPVERSEPIELNFCLLATPVRPFPEGWRGLVRDGVITRPGEHERIDNGIGEPVRFRVWWSHNPGMTQHHGYPVANQTEEDLRRSWTFADGVADIQHHYPNITTAGKPVSTLYYGDWANVTTDDLLDQLTLKPPTGGRVDWNTNIRDFWIWQFNEFMKLGLDGLYCDVPYIYPSYNDRTGGAVHGEDGKVHPSYGMLGLREYFRRMRSIAYEHSDWPWIDLHMSGQLMLPFYPYCDSFLNGEHLNMRLKRDDPDYFRVLPVAELKAQYLGYQWGVAPFLLPELPSGFRKSVEHTRQVLAYFLPHDVLLWRAWGNTAEMNRALKALQHDFRIGEPDSFFLPYWEAGDIIAGQDASLVVSAHIRPGKVMLVIANWSTGERQADLTLDLKALGLAAVEGLTATEVLDGAEFVLAGTHLTGPVGPRDYRLVLLAGGE
ncbi:MAG: LamG domain-containing protein [Armatimonadetes bacterium]|nr:LamG domain-containing protein [Armatimonadota bacterium]